VEQFGAWSRAERVETGPETALELLRSHGRQATPSNRRSACRRASAQVHKRRPAHASPSLPVPFDPRLSVDRTSGARTGLEVEGPRA
jgi:hypothetical protein